MDDEKAMTEETIEEEALPVADVTVRPEPVVEEEPLKEGEVQVVMTWGEFAGVLSVAVGRITNLYVDPATNLRLAPLFDAFAPLERLYQRLTNLMVENLNERFPALDPIPDLDKTKTPTTEELAQHSRDKARRSVEVEERQAEIQRAVSEETTKLRAQTVTVRMMRIMGVRMDSFKDAFDFERAKEKKISTADKPYEAKVLMGAHVSALRPFVEFV